MISDVNKTCYVLCADDEEDYCDTSDVINDQDLEKQNLKRPEAAKGRNVNDDDDHQLLNGVEQLMTAASTLLVSNKPITFQSIDDAVLLKNGNTHESSFSSVKKTHDYNHNNHHNDDYNFSILTRQDALLGGNVSNADKEVNRFMEGTTTSNGDSIFLNGNGIMNDNDVVESNGQHRHMHINKFGGELNSPPGSLAFGASGMGNQAAGSSSLNRMSRPGKDLLFDYLQIKRSSRSFKREVIFFFI
jgi:hypothetical protein